ncbi:hypothetical protein MVUOKPPV_CDS0181 [Klebsiella phage phi1_175008]|uniref:Uncharacterized protein n=1 Tax=Klebsiella phage phi1_175008 TaxID=3127744 RepID=A0ACD5FRX4_9CAUD
MFYIIQKTDGAYSVTSEPLEGYLLSGDGELPECFDEALALLNTMLLTKGINDPFILECNP